MYPYNRRFLSQKHPLKKKGKYFDGKVETRSKPVTRTGVDIYDMVKDLKVIFGKGPGSQPVPKGWCTPDPTAHKRLKETHDPCAPLVPVDNTNRD